MKKVDSKKTGKQIKVKGKSGQKSGTRTKITSEKAASKSRLTQSKSNLNPVREAKTKTNKSKPLTTAKSKIEIYQKARAQLIKQYESGIKLINKHEFEKARDIFEKAIKSSGKDKAISERIKTYLQLCEQKLKQESMLSPTNDEERYNLAVFLMNNGHYQDSIYHLNKVLKKNPNCDYAIYALAISMCQLGDDKNALNNLKEAIRLKSENRFLAQRESDFEPLLNDSRFMSLVYPEEPVDDPS